VLSSSSTKEKKNNWKNMHVAGGVAVQHIILLPSEAELHILLIINKVNFSVCTYLSSYVWKGEGTTTPMKFFLLLRMKMFWVQPLYWVSRNELIRQIHLFSRPKVSFFWCLSLPGRPNEKHTTMELFIEGFKGRRSWGTTTSPNNQTYLYFFPIMSFLLLNEF
jgi:hypothetical protein